MFLSVGTPRHLSEIKIAAIDFRARRKDYGIAVIDDEGFNYRDLLITHDFDIKVFNDIEDIRTVQAYPIIVCDIKGVGKKFGSPKEGAHIISEIRKTFPDKYLIAFTGHQFDTSYNAYFQMCDAVLTKDLDSDGWVSQLDAAISTLMDPTEQWKKLRRFLLERQVDLYIVFQLEQQYINAVKERHREKFPQTSTIRELPGDVRNVLTNFAGSYLANLLASQ